MSYAITVANVTPRLLAAVNRRVRPGLVGAVFSSVQDEVWAFVRDNPGLRTDGHNVFYYNHTSADSEGMDVHFGVEVTRRFAPTGNVVCIETPGGRAAILVHRGAYTGLDAAHAALRDWFRASGERIGAWSLEIYGDWHEDVSQLETAIAYALT